MCYSMQFLWYREPMICWAFLSQPFSFHLYDMLFILIAMCVLIFVCYHTHDSIDKPLCSGWLNWFPWRYQRMNFFWMNALLIRIFSADFPVLFNSILSYGTRFFSVHMIWNVMWRNSFAKSIKLVTDELLIKVKLVSAKNELKQNTFCAI